MTGKRTYEQSLTFFKRDTAKRGEGREFYKTNPDDVEKIVNTLLTWHPRLHEKLWLDPCAGDGVWGKVIEKHGVTCLSFDIEPKSSSVLKQDFFGFNDVREDLFIIGNPPFSMVEKFVEKALTLVPECYFLGGSQLLTGRLSSKVCELHRFEGREGNQKDKRSKLIFEDTLGKKVPVWCCGALFDRNEHEKFSRTGDGISFATSVKCVCFEDERVTVL